jgi:hypothetical protein
MVVLEAGYYYGEISKSIIFEKFKNKEEILTKLNEESDKFKDYDYIIIREI